MAYICDSGVSSVFVDDTFFTSTSTVLRLDGSADGWTSGPRLLPKVSKCKVTAVKFPFVVDICQIIINSTKKCVSWI